MNAWFLYSVLAAFGGWASISVDDMPDYVVARQPVTLTFVVRQHGFSPLSGLQPRIDVQASGVETIAAPAAAAGEAGRYTATLNLPQAGQWTITIHSGFGNSRLTLLPLTAIAPGATAPAPLAAAERGRRMFAAKGCVTCHVHTDVPGSGTVAVGPDLSNRRLAPDYLRQFLANPAMRTQKMPNFNLSQSAIAALTAFISGERTGAE